MKLKHLFLSVCLLSGLYAFADDPIVELLKKKLLTPYTNYFEKKRERVYVHLSRSEYIAGDNIWFKVYVYDPAERLLTPEANKLYAELFDQNGKLVERKVLFLENGVASSFFKLKNEARAGNYTLRAYTNWMRNFQDQPFSSSIIQVTALGEQKTTPFPSDSTKATIDLQVFPEGGLFVEGVDNHFGVKTTLPSGHGTIAYGYVLSPTNDTIQLFKTNKVGISSFTLFDAKAVNYKVGVIYNNNQKKEIEMASPVQKGIAVFVNNLLPNKLLISLKTNQQTFTEIRDKPIHVLIHNNGTVHQSLYVKFTELEKMFSVNRSLLGPGVNYITIFNEQFKPLAERVIFNNSKIPKGALTVSQHLQSDSLTLEVSTLDTASNTIAANLSFSVLPGNTTGNNFSSSLFADVILNASVKGSVEDPNYYFEKSDYQHQLDLDNLLLTQAWRKYQWPDILVEKVPGIKYPYENGFTVNATAENRFKGGKPEKNSMFSLFSPDNNLMLSAQADENGSISFKNLYLNDSTKVIVSAAGLKGGGWNRNIKANIVYHRLDTAISVNKFNDEYTPAPIATNFVKPLTEKLYELKEVVVRAEKKKNPFEGNLYSNMGDRVFEINKDNYARYTTIEDLLRNEFFLRVSRTAMGDLYIDMGRGPTSMMGSNQPSLIIDGMVMSDLSYLSIISVQDIQAVAVNKSANAMLGMRGGNGSINIVTRRTGIDWGPDGISNTRTLAVKGYAKPVAFFTPKYVLKPETETFQKYATIFWKPDIQTDSTGKTKFKFFVPKDIDDLIIRAEGISENGSIYYYNEKLVLSKGL
ncbi:TonB-dependent receptor [Solitalea canadensis]|uniref:Large extracellular alpha-helical protein n=1 Tax=Solitalea canadensis (strain ATCC 29591 / DSM 3403 / JCM 21819 / LMG 8368 / NBRC 15130 / NCIMB 12057 / USAM 9D) TaxID=929556 RepID=H8KWS0_SOLCM|nr:hypothetical protein [Solitalea canadensis]AFD08249.1 large extracellular alpha-helical protein [Solitalea canadensis DSM 3403]